MDMQTFIDGCRSCDPAAEPERAAELLRAAAELGEAIQSKRQKSDKVDYDRIIRAYHTSCPLLPKVTKLTDKRKRSIRACMAQGFTAEDLLKAFDKAAHTPFLLGKNERSWRANFDFIIKPDNLVKILEGTYGSAAAQSSADHSYNLGKIAEYAMNNTPTI